MDILVRLGRNRDVLSPGVQQNIFMTTKLTGCPMCGSRKIRRVRRNVKIDVGQLHFVVPTVGFDECPQCGQQLFDLPAMEKIEAHRPPIARAKIRRRSA